MSEINPVLKILSAYRKVFPQSKIDEEGLALYVALLKPLSLAEVSAAMAKLAITCKFFPSVAEIFEAAGDVRRTAQNSQVPSVDEAWNEVLHQVHDAFIYQQPKFSTREIEQAALHMGWTALCNLGARDINTSRAQFRDIYTDILRRKKNKAQNEAILRRMPAQHVQQLVGNVSAKLNSAVCPKEGLAL